MIKFKHEMDLPLFFEMKQRLCIIAHEMSQYCLDNNLPFVITRTIAKKLKASTSDTHEQGRAFDVSVKGWNRDNIEKFVEFHNHKYRDYGAISQRDRVARCVVYHDVGHGAHFHIQVKHGV